MTIAINVYGVQMDRVVGDKPNNLAAMIDHIRRAGDEGADLVVFPELSTTGYFATEHDLKWFDLAEPSDGESISTMCRTASQIGVSLVVPFFEFDRHLRTYFNSAAVISASGELLGLYRKRHIPETLWMYEKFYFTPGNLPYPVFDLGSYRVGVSICYDRHFPETFRLLTTNGAEVVLSVNNTPTARSKRVWEAEIVASASSNGVFIMQLNAVGQEGTQNFFGHSFLAAPDGSIIVALASDPGTLAARLDLDQIQLARTHYSTMRDTRWEDFGLGGPPVYPI